MLRTKYEKSKQLWRCFCPKNKQLFGKILKKKLLVKKKCSCFFFFLVLPFFWHIPSSPSHQCSSLSILQKYPSMLSHFTGNRSRPRVLQLLQKDPYACDKHFFPYLKSTCISIRSPYPF